MLTDEQFEAAMKLRGTSKPELIRAAYYYFVNGVSLTDASKRMDMSRETLFNKLARVKRDYNLACIIAGVKK